MNWLGFGGTPLDIDITLANASSLRQVLGKNEAGEVEPLYLLTQGDTVSGSVTVKYKGKKVEHQGIKIELLGQIEFLHDSGNPHEFTSLERPLDDAGDVTADKQYSFEFLNVDKPYETYSGNNVRLRYFLRVKVSRSYSANIAKSLDFAVQNLQTEPELNHSIKMEVGIEDCLHIEVTTHSSSSSNNSSSTARFTCHARANGRKQEAECSG